jgi:Ca2+-binding EF-hand superfamily protein
MDTKKGKNKGKKGATTTAAPQTSEDKTVTSTTKESTPPKVPQKLENNASVPPATKQERYKKAFALMDKDSSGAISKAEFKAFFDDHGLGKTWTHEQMDDMFDEIDTDHGGTIDVVNFLDALTKEHPNRDLATFVNELLHEKKVPEE